MHSAQLLLSAAGIECDWPQVGRALEARGVEMTVEHSPAATCAVPSALSAGRTRVAGAPIQLRPFSWQVERRSKSQECAPSTPAPRRSHWQT